MVSFRHRRDPTPVSGNRNVYNDVYVLSIKYDEVFLNDEDLIKNKVYGLQFMILDIGSPTSLMGKLSETLSELQLKRVVEMPAKEKFKFGPSKVYDALKRGEVPLIIKDIEILVKFFIIDGLVPNLIGYNILEPFGGVIDTEDRVIEFKRLERCLELTKTLGGHYVLPCLLH